MEFVLAFIIGLAISTVTLTVSMILFGRYWGIDFGEAKAAIAKGAGLLLVVNLVSLMPIGCINYLIVLAIWFLGLMFLFQLDLLEALLLTLVNWVISVLVYIAIIAMLAPVIGEV